MNKREILAWRLWLERRPTETRRKWAHLSHVLPLFFRVWFARYVAFKFMGGRSRFRARLVAFVVFHFVAGVLFRLMRAPP